MSTTRALSQHPHAWHLVTGGSALTLALVAYVGLTPDTTEASTETATSATTEVAAAGWTLRWADEFNGSALDTSKWTPERNSTFGDGNQELACLTDRSRNLQVRDGFLRITARRESTPYRCGNSDERFPNGRQYTSAMVHTKNKVDWRYGRFEMRAKTASATGASKGLWGAAWFKPTDGSGGEIDLLEVLGTGPGEGRSKVHTAIHDGVHPVQQNDYALPASAPGMAETPHTYAMEWSLTQMRWYVDGALVWTRNGSTTPWFGSVYNRPFFLRLNLAVGGSWPGAPTAATRFPAEYAIDWFRVYSAS